MLCQKNEVDVAFSDSLCKTCFEILSDGSLIWEMSHVISAAFNLYYATGDGKKEWNELNSEVRWLQKSMRTYSHKLEVNKVSNITCNKE